MAGELSREVRLRNRPEGVPRESDFELAEVVIPDIGEGQMLVQNIYMSVDPYMLPRLVSRHPRFRKLRATFSNRHAA